MDLSFVVGNDVIGLSHAELPRAITHLWSISVDLHRSKEIAHAEKPSEVLAQSARFDAVTAISLRARFQTDLLAARLALDVTHTGRHQASQSLH